MEENDEPTTETRSELLHGLIEMMRKHRVLTVVGVAGVGLLGGLELATGVLLGVGVSLLVRKPTAHPAGEPHGFRERARAVVLAARGKITAAEQNGHAPVHQDPPAEKASH